LMFAVEGFVKTRSPCCSKSFTRILVVEDFPALPETRTTPSGMLLSAFRSKLGAMKLTTRPGSAEPPPRLKRRSRNRSDFPSDTARKESIYPSR
jgi:hypothetical protein